MSHPRYFLFIVGITLASTFRMPRKPLLYTDEHPYHIMARSNNKEWFYLPIIECWKIFSRHLFFAQKKFGFKVYLFVLMDNHYHLIGSCSSKHNLGEVMAWLQKSVSREINKQAQRTNHIFGGPYKACLIRHPEHFSAVFKYVARNPVEAGITSSVELYSYSTLNTSLIPTTERDEWFADIPVASNDLRDWLNQSFQQETRLIIQQNLKKTVFEPLNRSNRRQCSF
ncbi:transposase [Bdellovibrio svalbardensis]|uniref:Transposase n=1 Tax=Bdellovibrio svalbardensis TaxID=2972972 RepID=A0ABT6DE20_9BACT|nr:transposase [Bdellovibrio svalbardensis]MDG0815081.1 transposase [Bdellovibrio svalbardensis]